MLLELLNLSQQLFGAFEDVFHGLVPVAILESLAAATGADVITAHAGEVQRPLKRWTDRTDRRARAGRLGRLGRLADVLRTDRICRRARLGAANLGLAARLGLAAGADLLFCHRPKSYPKLVRLKGSLPFGSLAEAQRP